MPNILRWFYNLGPPPSRWFMLCGGQGPGIEKGQPKLAEIIDSNDVEIDLQKP
jgi:hypothetical protein